MEQLKPVSGGGNFHTLPLRALIGSTPPSPEQHQPLQFSKAVFSLADYTVVPEPKSSGTVMCDGNTLNLVRARSRMHEKIFITVPSFLEDGCEQVNLLRL
jgi:hypothetical protein